MRLPALQLIHCTKPGATSHALGTPKQALSKSHRPQLLPAFQVLPKSLHKKNRLSRQGDDQKVEAGRSHGIESRLSQQLWVSNKPETDLEPEVTGTKMSHV